MGYSMLRRWMSTSWHKFAVVEPASELRAKAAYTGAEAYSSATDLPASFIADVVIIATKPQAVAQAVATYAPLIADHGLIISIAAGVNLRTIEANVTREIAVIRCMPNMPASIGESMTVCCASQGATPDQLLLSEDLMSAIGKVMFIEDEGDMDAVTAVSGSGPAYLFHFIEALAEAGRAAGLEVSLALALSRQTVLGAARLATEVDLPPEELRRQVTSPNGTTAAAMEVLMNVPGGLQDNLTRAVLAAKARSVELSR